MCVGLMPRLSSTVGCGWNTRRPEKGRFDIINLEAVRIWAFTWKWFSKVSPMSANRLLWHRFCCGVMRVRFHMTPERASEYDSMTWDSRSHIKVSLFKQHTNYNDLRPISYSGSSWKMTGYTPSKMSSSSKPGQDFMSASSSIHT